MAVVISAQLVKELRDRTGAGMMDCKKALVETGGDLEKASVWLRENGITKAAKKATRVAAEGICSALINGNKTLVYEINCETDFVTKTDKFQAVVEKVGQALLKSKATNTEEALKVKVEEGTVEDLIIQATAIIGEKIDLRNVSVITKKDDEKFEVYSHMNGRIVVVITYKGKEDAAHDVALHVAAMNPTYLSRADVDEAFLAKEKAIYRQEALNEGKPEKIVDKIAEGKVNRYLKDICLLDQQFVKNSDITVEQFLKQEETSVSHFYRIEVGVGVEKE